MLMEPEFMDSGDPNGVPEASPGAGISGKALFMSIRAAWLSAYSSDSNRSIGTSMKRSGRCVVLQPHY